MFQLDCAQLLYFVALRPDLCQRALERGSCAVYGLIFGAPIITLEGSQGISFFLVNIPFSKILPKVGLQLLLDQMHRATFKSNLKNNKFSEVALYIQLVAETSKTNSGSSLQKVTSHHFINGSKCGF